jgi:hypothetical protein
MLPEIPAEQIPGQLTQVCVCQLVAAIRFPGRPAILGQTVERPAPYRTEAPFNLPTVLAGKFRQGLDAQTGLGGHYQA